MPSQADRLFNESGISFSYFKGPNDYDNTDETIKAGDTNLQLYREGVAGFKKFLTELNTKRREFEGTKFFRTKFDLHSQSIPYAKWHNLHKYKQPPLDNPPSFPSTYLDELSTHLEKGGYFPFKSVKFELTTILDQTAITALTRLMKAFNHKIENFELIIPSDISTEQQKNISTYLHQQEITTSLTLIVKSSLESGVSQIANVNFSNITASNRRKKNAEARRIKLPQELGATAWALTTSEATVTATPTNSGNIRRCKRISAAMLIAGLGQHLQLTQHQSQQQQREQKRDQQQTFEQRQHVELRQDINYGTCTTADLVSDTTFPKATKDSSYLSSTFDEFDPLRNTGSRSLSDLTDTWRCLVGYNQAESAPDDLRLKKNSYISFLTNAAAKEVFHNRENFMDGLNLDNLPDGFYVEQIPGHGHSHSKTDAGKLVLCFNRTAANPNKNPLTITLLKQPQASRWLGNIEQFTPLKAQSSSPKQFDTEYRTLFDDLVLYHTIYDQHHNISTVKNFLLELIQGEASETLEPYQTFFDFLAPGESMLNHAPQNLLALSHVIFEEGKTGIDALMQIFNQVRAIDKGSYFASFKNAFVDRSKNFMEFLSDDVQNTISGIAAFSAEELIWWKTLTEQREGWSDLTDLFQGFTYFCQEFKRLAPDLKLPIPCHITNVKNMKLGLDRLLIVLKNTDDIKRKIQNLEGIKLDTFGENYTSRYSYVVEKKASVHYIDTDQIKTSEEKHFQTLKADLAKIGITEDSLFTSTLMNFKDYPNEHPLASPIKKYLLATHQAELQKHAAKRIPADFYSQIENIINSLNSDSIDSPTITLNELPLAYENRGIAVRSLIETLSAVQKRWPKRFGHLLTLWEKSPQIKYCSIELLNTILRVLLTQGSNIVFPLSFFETLLNHPDIKDRTLTIDKQTALIDITTLILGEDFTLQQKDRLLRLAFSGVVTSESIAMMHEWTQDWEKSSINDLLTLIELDPKDTNLSRITFFKEITNDNRIMLKFFALMAENKSKKSYNALYDKFNPIETPQRSLIFKIVTLACSRKYRSEQALELIDNLSKQSLETLQELAKLYDRTPFPVADRLLNALNHPFEIASFREDFEKSPCGQRDADKIKAQFNASTINTAIAGMRNLSSDRPLLYSQQLKLQQWFAYVNAIGNTHPILKRDDGTLVSVRELSRDEMDRLIANCRATLQKSDGTEEEKLKARLDFIALAREAFYRANPEGIFPHSTQILSVLNTLLQKGNYISEISTGEGKSITTALYAALLQLEGYTVDVCTSNMALAERDFEDAKDFLHYLGIHDVSLIHASSSSANYRPNGIHYSTVAQLSLFRSLAQLEGVHQTRKTALVLDEADFTILDDSTQYRASINLDKTIDPYFNPTAWIYPLILEFVRTEKFLDQNADIETDVQNAREYILEKHPQFASQLSEIKYEKIDMWLNSAYTAIKLYEENQQKRGLALFSVREEKREVNGEEITISFARPIVHTRVSQNQFGEGVQQFLHTLLLEQNPTGEFPIDAELDVLAATSSKNFIDYYRKNGRVLGLTGTSGSEAERLEQYQKFGLTFTRIPPHHKSQFVMQQPVLARDQNTYEKKIIEKIIHARRQSSKISQDGRAQPILIICEDAAEATKMHALVNKSLQEKVPGHRTTIQLYNALDPKVSEEDIVQQAGQSDTITITTPALTRGINITPTHSEGLLAIHAFLSDIERDEFQGLKRAGRQGKKGKGIVIVNQEKLMGETPQSLQPWYQKLYPPTMDDFTQAAGAHRHEVGTNEKTRARRLIEAYSDVKNELFGSFLTVLEIVTEQGDKEQRKKLLESWKVFLTKLDTQWAKIVEKSHETRLETTVENIADFASQEWSNFLGMVPGADITALQHTSRALQDKALAHTLVEKKAHPAVESIYSLPTSVNFDKIFCDLAPDFRKNLDFEKDAITAELKIQFEKVKNFLTALNNFAPHYQIKKLIQKLDECTAPGTSNAQKVEVLLSVLLETKQCIYTDKTSYYAQNSIKPIFQSYHFQLMLLVKWSQDDTLKDTAEKAHTDHVEGVLKAKEMPCEFYLQELSADKMRIEKQLSAGPKKNTVANHFDMVKAQLLSLLAAYSTKWMLANDRKGACEALKTALTTATTASEILTALNNARLSAMKSDLKADQKLFLFHRNKNGSRLEAMLETMRKRLIGTTDAATLDSLANLEFNDMKNILQIFSQRLGVQKKYSVLKKDIDTLTNSLPTSITQETAYQPYQAILVLRDNLDQYHQSLENDFDPALRNFYRQTKSKCEQIALYLQQCDTLHPAAQPDAMIREATRRAAAHVTSGWNEQKEADYQKTLFDAKAYKMYERVHPSVLKAKGDFFPVLLAEETWKRFLFNIEREILAHSHEETTLDIMSSKIGAEKNGRYPIEITMNWQKAGEAIREIKMTLEVDPKTHGIVFNFPGITEIQIPAEITVPTHPSAPIKPNGLVEISAKPAENSNSLPQIESGDSHAMGVGKPPKPTPRPS